MLQDVLDTLTVMSSGQAERARHAGEFAPSFRLANVDGTIVSSNALLAAGPLVLVFFRGGWCPHARLELRAFESFRCELENLGAGLVAVSMQVSAHNLHTAVENSLHFPILSDRGGQVARTFGLRHTLPAEVAQICRERFGIDLPTYHEENHWRLPLPARYVIDADGAIEYAEVNLTPGHKPTPSDLKPILERCRLRSQSRGRFLGPKMG